jgi:hypothetical protein
MITVSALPPEIKQSYNPFLLMTAMQRMHKDYLSIGAFAIKKLKDCPGRKREFDKLADEWERVYGVKEIEEANYKAEVQEKNKKRSCIPTAGGTMVFKRIRSTPRPNE